MRSLTGLRNARTCTTSSQKAKGAVWRTAPTYASAPLRYRG
jgi:hypothetical protein